MKRLMIILAIIAAIPAASALDMYYNLTMTYDKGQVSLGSVSIVPLTSYDLDYYNTLNDYTAIIMDENKALSIYYFNFNLWSHAVYSKNGELADSRDITLDRNTISAYFPYKEGATEIVIRDAKLDKVLTAELKKPAEIKEAAEKSPKKKEFPLNYALAAVALALAATILWLWLRKKK